MKEIDDFLQFLLDHESDERVSFHKKMKYGYRYYYVQFNVDDKPENQTFNPNGLISTRIIDSVQIIIDNRNSCIELIYNHGSESLIIEDKVLLEKWSSILDEYLSKDINIKIKNVFENALISCHDKGLHREYQMKKILPNNESI